MSHFLSAFPVFSIARVVLETTSPLAVASGRTNHVFDSDLVRDASGLPMIPGTALAGVLRHLYWRQHGQDEMERIFGFQDRDDGRTSLLEVSAGVIHDSRNRPASKHYCGGDALLDFARETRHLPALRERVAINQRGAAKPTEKFDCAVLPPGFRFSVELVLHSQGMDDPAFQRLRALFAHPHFRLGASTRAGFGAVSVIHVAMAVLNLKVRKDAERFCKLNSDIGSNAELTGWTKQDDANQATTQSDAITNIVFKLTPIAAWRFGQGLTSLLGGTDKAADMLPRVERRVKWNGGVGHMGADEIVIPASSLKGALRHRAVFYACCAAGYFADATRLEPPDSPEKIRVDEAIKAIFGDASDNADGSVAGQVGNLIINDLYLAIPADETKAVGTQMHNAIDRFSGGVRDRMLFSEQLLFDIGQPLEIALSLDEKRIGMDTEAGKLGISALKRALDDLKEGRLALGGGVSKGHGLFTANPATQPTVLADRERQHAN